MPRRIGTETSMTRAQLLDAANLELDAVRPSLILIGHAELLPRLHDSHLRGSGAWSAFTMRATLSLAEADEWDHAFEILD